MGVPIAHILEVSRISSIKSSGVASATETPNEQRFVRIKRIRRAGFVEFDFSIGDPNLYLEMILPQQAFDEFCHRHAVIFLGAREGEEIDRANKRWRDGVDIDA